MASYVFIAVSKDTSSGTSFFQDNIETVKELKENLLSNIEEANSIYGSRWYADFDEIEVEDIGMTEDAFNDIIEEI